MSGATGKDRLWMAAQPSWASAGGCGEEQGTLGGGGMTSWVESARDHKNLNV